VPEEELKQRIRELEADLANSRKRLVQGEADLDAKVRTIAELNEQVSTLSAASREVGPLRETVATLTSEKEQLLQTVDRLRAERIRPTPSQLVQSFRTAMDELRTSLTAQPDDRVGYTISQFNVDLKSLIAVDKASQTLQMVLPEPGEALQPETLSTIRFVFQTVPKPASEEEALVTVPHLLGVSKDAAMSLLSRENLTLGELSEQTSSATPGTVIGQDPEGGDQVPAQSAVRLVVAAIPKVAVPSLIGLSLDGARAVLDERGLNAGTMNDEPSSATPGAVIAQDPVADTLVARGSPVALVLARPLSVTVPDLAGLKEENALKTLRDHGLVLGKKTTQAEVEGAGAVLSQEPAAHAQIPPGSEVSLVIGVAGQVKVPSLVEMSLKRAKTRLEKVSLTLGLVTASQHATLNDVVLKQSPAAGEVVTAGTAVHVEIARRTI
jgi:eukaryotic-like serine/threonine-protein kinase